MLIKSFITLLFLVTNFLFSQNSEIYSKKHSFLGSKIVVEQFGKRYPRQLLIEFQDNDIVKQENISDGSVAGSWVVDLDKDGNLEIIVYVRSAGSGGYGELHFYEVSNNKLISFEFPSVDSKIFDGYQGHDEYSVSKNFIEHKFPMYKDSDPNCCPTGGDVSIKYVFQNNTFQEIESIKKTKQAVLKDDKEYFKLAKSAYSQENYKIAVENFEILAENFPNSSYHANALFMLGLIYSNELNNKQKAKKYYKAFINKYPDHSLIDDAKYELKSL